MATVMTDLRELLNNSTRRFLLAIGRACGLPLSWGAPKTTLVDELAEALLDDQRLTRLWSEISDTELAILRILQSAGGRLPSRYLTRRFGELRPYRPWRSSEPSRPWQNPASPLERLRYLGLIFWDRQHDDLAIPDELPALAPVIGPVAWPMPAPGETAAYPGADLACHDLAVLLALLQRDDIPPRQQRWLTPNILRTWGQLCRVQPEASSARGELQTGRRRFLHYLAENAGWVSPGGAILKPTPLAWHWLESSRSEQLAALWHSWSQAQPDIWRAFRLPGARWLPQPALLLTAIHQHLTRLNPGTPRLLAELLLTEQPDLLDLFPANLLDVEKVWRQTIAELLTGPLVWLGALQLQDGSHHSGEAAEYRLTTVGQAWLEDQGSLDTAPPTYTRFAVKANFQPDFLDSNLKINLSTGLPTPSDLAVVIELTEPVISAGDSERYDFTMTAASCIRAVQRGWAKQSLVDRVRRLPEQPLTGQEAEVLKQWAEAAHKITLSYALVLESVDSRVISRLAADRRGRDLIHRTFSPRAVAVAPNRLGPLVRRLLAQEGIPPALSGILQSDVKSKSYPLAGVAAQQWLAVRVYQALGQFIKLPGRIDQAVTDQLLPLLSEAELAAVETATREIVEALQRAIDGWAAFPTWSAASIATENHLAIIEQALLAGYRLELQYYAAGSELVTRRQVEPYRLEWRGDIPYLVGFCQYRQAERVFRVDRIQKLTVVDQDD